MPQTITRALITGASSGIGAAYARRLARDGVALVLVARRGDRLEALARELDVEVEVLVADLESEAGLTVVEARLAAEPAIDMLLNNAGFGIYGSFAVFNPDDAVEIIKLNVVAPTRLASAAVKAMLPRGRGAIVNVASGLAYMRLATTAVYSGTKSYIAAFTRALQTDVGGRGLQVQLLVPGVIRTEFGIRSKSDYDAMPQHLIMDVDAFVDAAVAGLKMGEAVCIPSLPDVADYQAFEEAERKLSLSVSLATPAARYGV